MSVLTRRRFLTISAAVALAGPVHADTRARWQGQALGAPASMQIVGLDAAQAVRVFARVEQELTRLEDIFSLYRPHSQISRLNREGILYACAPELLELLGLCATLHDRSGGAFDPTVQPLWQALATGADTDQARDLVGWEHVRFDAGEVRLGKKGMALTLNGIAQGAVTDRIAELLHAEGLRDVLIDMGEIAAMGQHGDGTPWQVGIAEPKGDILRRTTLRDRAIATSAPQGTLMGQTRDQPHIVDPRGGSAMHKLVSVSAPSAALADGLSTALCLMDAEAGRVLINGFPGTKLEILV